MTRKFVFLALAASWLVGDILISSALAQDEVWKRLTLQAAQYQLQGKFAEQLNSDLEALRVATATFGAEHRKTALSHVGVGLAYENRGRYEESEEHFRRALEIFQKVRGPVHPDVALSLDELGGLYFLQGRYAEAEATLQQAVNIEERTYGRGHVVTSVTMGRLASVFEAQGKYADAEATMRRAVELVESLSWPRNADSGLALANLAGFFLRQGRFEEAEALYRRVLKLIAMRQGSLVGHPYVRATTAVALGSLYRAQGRHAEAEAEIRKELASLEQFFGPEDPNVAGALVELAGALFGLGRHEDAAGHYQRALAIYEKNFGPQHPRTGRTLEGLAQLNYATGNLAQATRFFDRRVENLGRQFQYHFAYMSEPERLAFVDTVHAVFPLFYSYCYTYRDRDPALLGKMYDVLLWQKGFVAASVAGLRAQIVARGDAEALALLDRLQARKSRLAQLITSPPADRQEGRRLVQELERETNELERDLARRSATLAEEQRLQGASWRDVQAALKPGEAAVEIARFRFHDGNRLTAKSYYVALVLTPQSTAAPTLVVLGEAAILEGSGLEEYRRLVERKAAPAQHEATPSAPTGTAFLQPLEAALGPSRSVYLSPDGILNMISPALVTGGNGKLLIESYDLHLLNSTRDLLRQTVSSATESAVLVGNPSFDLPETQHRAMILRLGSAERGLPLLARAGPSSALRGLREGNALEPLPGTARELEAARKLLEERAWQVQVYADALALEEAVKRVRRPRLLHLATHGFFLGDQVRQFRDRLAELPVGLENPMLRSGLFFAGAGRALLGQKPAEGLEDGVLTAYEATGLDLQGTDLVVLSACDTGLGEVLNTEGVFGLRRAFQIAGARAVLMSLWAVPDRETQELMGLFYENWLQGAENHDALRAAQLEMRRRIRERFGNDLPYYWGGFVLIGP